MKATILVIEDDPTNRALVTKLLRHLGHDSLEAEDGAQALQLAKDRLPDLILLDLGLPQVDGCQVARQLKSDPRTMAVPLVALTAYALNGDRARALEAGCDAYVAKPFDPDALAAMIQQTLARRPARPGEKP